MRPVEKNSNKDETVQVDRVDLVQGRGWKRGDGDSFFRFSRGGKWNPSANQRAHKPRFSYVLYFNWTLILLGHLDIHIHFFVYLIHKPHT